MSTLIHNGWGTLDDAAEVLGVSTQTIRRRIADGSIRALRFGPRLLRVDMQSLEQSGTPIAWTGTAA
ncbi:helix-turn-helix domain-containing protein [Microbacterium oxydans]|uniref:helix-turn-helix domain-containing protein n=1 Tax=Microbacterium oxydans TaxID=82380 RepID=UPI0005ED2A92|nr:helix-turn-helix domain-containing protein [Microbacterium oxydans]